MNLNTLRRRAPRGRCFSRPVLESLEARVVLDGTWQGYGGNAQHTALSGVASQPLDTIRWQTPVDLAPQYSGNDLLIHYGSPMVTAADTVIVPVKTGASNGFELQAHSGTDGTVLWTLPTSYILPPHGWTPSYSPTLAGNGRIAYPDAGGVIDFATGLDSSGATQVSRVAFYGTAAHDANAPAYDGNVFVSTPLTSDAAGDIYFGFVVTGSTPLNLQSGIARIAADGTATYTTAAAASTDSGLTSVAQNCAPALSLDGKTLYIAVNSGNFGRGDLLALNATTLAPIAKVALKDPKTGQDAALTDDSTASPLVGPDGDVYYGTLENPFGSNHDRGWLYHFSGDLSQAKPTGAFGWDDTASIVPTSMVPSYTGTSTYLIMTKYNNYAGIGGDGVNRIAIIDPNATMTDPISGATTMRVVESIAGPTPDAEFLSDHPYAVREWCINTAAVDPATDSILANSEDGKLYRWNLGTNTFSQVIVLTPGIGEAYTPTIIGADGTVYAINNATLFAVGAANATAPPSASADGYSVAEDASLTVAAPGVLANDNDGGGKAALSAILVSGPSHGVVSLKADGSFLYTPTALYRGPDSFVYEVTDGTRMSNPAVVSLTVTPVNHAPAAIASGASIAQDSKLSVDAPGVLAGASDVDPNTTLTAVLVANPTHGTLTLNPNGSYVYTPSAGYRGVDSFTFKASDGTAQSAATTVSLTVTPFNHAPVAQPENYTTTENGSLSVFAAQGVLANDSDPDPGTTLTAVLVAGPTQGKLTLNPDGSFLYTPTAFTSGSDSFSYRASDGNLSSAVTKVSITVTAMNLPPSALPSSYSVGQDTRLTTAAPGVLTGATDPNPNAKLTAVLVSNASHGTLVLNADGSFAYTPTAGYRGPDSFVFAASDGTLTSDPKTVSIDVAAVNHPPVAQPESYATREDTPLTVFAAQGVLANDSDPDPGTILSAVLVTGPTRGTLLLNADGSFLYKPNPLTFGTDSFVYQASDGVKLSSPVTVSLAVSPVDHPPVASGTTISAVQGSLATVATATFTDVDGEPTSNFTASIDWGDRTPAGAATIAPAVGGYAVIGGHVYANRGVYLVTTTLSEGAVTTTVISRALVVASPVPLTGALSAASDSGVSSSDHITNVNTPTIVGTASAGDLITLIASGPNGTNAVGSTVASEDGTFQVSSGRLPDGVYTLGLASTDPLTSTTTTAGAGSVTIDTVGPRVSGTRVDTKTGRAFVTFGESLSGLDTSHLFATTTYIVTRTTGGRSFSVPVAAAVSSAPDTVAITLKTGKKLPRGVYSVSVASGTIRDLAGNPLEGATAQRLLVKTTPNAPTHRASIASLTHRVRTFRAGR